MSKYELITAVQVHRKHIVHCVFVTHLPWEKCNTTLL